MESLTTFLGNVLSGAGGPGADGMSFGQLLLAIGVAYFGGILSSLTPCVYPMIPITVSVVGGASGRLNWRALWVRGLIYVAGMAVVYSFLGVIAGVTGKVFGSLTNTSAWYLGLAIILTFASLVMMDVLPFDPAMIWTRVKSLFVREKKPIPLSGGMPTELGLLGVFALGASSGFIAAPCTTPVLASVLAYIANTQSVWLGFALMLSFSLGLGTLLLVLALFAGSLRVLPRSGAWMRVVKVGSGLLLLIVAQYLFFRAGSL